MREFATGMISIEMLKILNFFVEFSFKWNFFMVSVRSCTRRSAEIRVSKHLVKSEGPLGERMHRTPNHLDRPVKLRYRENQALRTGKPIESQSFSPTFRSWSLIFEFQIQSYLTSTLLGSIWPAWRLDDHQRILQKGVSSYGFKTYDSNLMTNLIKVIDFGSLASPKEIYSFPFFLCDFRNRITAFGVATME